MRVYVRRVVFEGSEGGPFWSVMKLFRIEVLVNKEAWLLVRLSGTVISQRVNKFQSPGWYLNEVIYAVVQKIICSMTGKSASNRLTMLTRHECLQLR